MEQPATASSQGEKSLRCTLEVFNDQCNWAVESVPVRVTKEILAQAFGKGFIRAIVGKKAPSSRHCAQRSASRDLGAQLRARPRGSYSAVHGQTPLTGRTRQPAGAPGGRYTSRQVAVPSSPAQRSEVARGRAGALVLAQAHGLLFEMSAELALSHNTVPASLSRSVSPLSRPHLNIIFLRVSDFHSDKTVLLFISCPFSFLIRLLFGFIEPISFLAF